MRVYIDLEALEHNVQILQDKAHGKHLAAVVKGDAYGHGIALVVPALISLGIERFVVSNIQEAYKLWNVGARWILVLHPTPEDIKEYIYLPHQLKRSIRLAIWDGCLLSMISPDIPLHLVVNTGFGMGIKDLENVSGRLWIEGIMGHIPFLADTNAQQYKRQEIYDHFMSVVSIYRDKWNIHDIHICNSASLFYLDGCKGTTMVRSGVGLYGYIEVKSVVPILKPAMWQVAKVVSVKHVRKGETVFYGEESRENITVAFVRAGYGDGYVGGKYGYHVATGEYIERVFHLTMNVSAFKVDENVVSVGDDIFLLGPRKHIRADEIALESGLSIEQVLTRAGLSQREALPVDIKDLLQS